MPMPPQYYQNTQRRTVMKIDTGRDAPIIEMEELAEELCKTYCEFELVALIKAIATEKGLKCKL